MTNFIIHIVGLNQFCFFCFFRSSLKWCFNNRLSLYPFLHKYGLSLIESRACSQQKQSANPYHISRITKTDIVASNYFGNPKMSSSKQYLNDVQGGSSNESGGSQLFFKYNHWENIYIKMTHCRVSVFIHIMQHCGNIHGQPLEIVERSDGEKCAEIKL